MNGIILAAGRGSRLAQYTKDGPKCLVELDGISLLDRQVEALRYAGASNVRVVVGWQAERMRRRGLDTIENSRWQETSMVDSLFCARGELLADETLVSYGDIIYSNETARALAQCVQPLVITYDPQWLPLWSRRFTDPLADAESFRIDAGGRVTNIGQRVSSVNEIQGQFMGLFRFTPTAWQEAERIIGEAASTKRSLDTTGLLQRVIEAGRIPLTAIPIMDPWCEIDQPSDIEIAREIALELDSRNRISRG